MKEARFYEELEGEKVKCRLCPWNCQISERERGVCGVRENREGKLYSLSYDNLKSGTTDPIEKKPLFNFAPGTRTYSICTPGCNWKCKYCQNWQLSQGSLNGKSVSPEEIVEAAKNSGARGISYTYTEPAIFYELAYETAKLAKEEGLYNTFVTNGYINPQPIKEIGPHLDAVTVDFKGSGDEEFLKEFAGVPSVDPVYTAIKEYRDQGVHVEITDLIVPRVGDSEAKIEQLVNWVRNNLGAGTPLHFLRFYPANEVQELPPTDVSKLEAAREIAESAGMEYVYLGNVRRNNDTRCPSCGNKVVNRSAGRLMELDLKDGRCAQCWEEVGLAGLEWVEGKRP
ncbi:AmmeMemoRadiSam system radical SAM enzyme [Candidatus Bipolaricaulota bacterium]|nr:AmmeMemoRadiSam system radical SAM enzyme [Candidatus Bipolaricaulota bacterium]